MVKKMLILVFFLASFQGCGRLSNPVSDDDYPPPDKATEDVVKDRTKGDPYRDTIRIVIDTSKDTTGAVDSSEIDFLIRIGGGLGKVQLDRVTLRDFRIDSVDAATLEFVSLDSPDTSRFNFPVVKGVCSATKVKVPSGRRYQVLVSLWYIGKCQWANYSIYDRSFSAVDTADLQGKSRDTLSLIFYESVRIKYFLTLKMPGTPPWTEGKEYLAYVNSTTTTPVLYKDGKLCGYYVMNDLRDKGTQRLTFSCDTGKVLITFVPDVMTMLTNGGVVMVNPDSIWFGIHETHEDSLGFIPLDDAPTRIRG